MDQDPLAGFPQHLLRRAADVADSTRLVKKGAARDKGGGGGEGGGGGRGGGGGGGGGGRGGATINHCGVGGGVGEKAQPQPQRVFVVPPPPSTTPAPVPAMGGEALRCFRALATDPVVGPSIHFTHTHTYFLSKQGSTQG